MGNPSFCPMPLPGFGCHYSIATVNPQPKCPNYLSPLGRAEKLWDLGRSRITQRLNALVSDREFFNIANRSQARGKQRVCVWPCNNPDSRDVSNLRGRERALACKARNIDSRSRRIKRSDQTAQTLLRCIDFSLSLLKTATNFQKYKGTPGFRSWQVIGGTITSRHQARASRHRPDQAGYGLTTAHARFFTRVVQTAVWELHSVTCSSMEASQYPRWSYHIPRGINGLIPTAFLFVPGIVFAVLALPLALFPRCACVCCGVS